MKYTVYLAFLLGTFSATAQVSITQISFDHNSNEIGSTEKIELDSLKDILEQDINNILSISVLGFTDTIGSITYNELLSKKRAEEVANYLKKAMSPSLISSMQIKWYGESMPDIPMFEIHSFTRSVDIIIERKPILVEKRDEKTATLNDLLLSLDQKPQVYRIIPADSNRITGLKGTIIDIPANSFDIRGKYNSDNVTIILKEYYTIADMILGGFTTMSGDQLLQSGGMIDIEAFVDGKSVKLRPGKKITIYFNSKRKLGDMQLFSGFRDDDGLVRWRLSKEKMSATNNYEYIELLEPRHFANSKMNSSCPYLFCGLREDLGLTNTAYKDRHTYNKIDWTAYRNYISEMKESFNVKTMSSLKAAINAWNKKSLELNKYVASSNTLGFMNCDRFISLPEEQKTKVLANVSVSENAAAYLAFTDLPGMMTTNYSEGQLIGFTNIGKMNSCTLIVIRKEGSQIFLSMQNFTTGEPITMQTNFITVTASELAERLSNLKNG